MTMEKHKFYIWKLISLYPTPLSSMKFKQDK